MSYGTVRTKESMELEWDACIKRIRTEASIVFTMILNDALKDFGKSSYRDAHELRLSLSSDEARSYVLIAVKKLADQLVEVPEEAPKKRSRKASGAQA